VKQAYHLSCENDGICRDSVTASITVQSTAVAKPVCEATLEFLLFGIERKMDVILQCKSEMHCK